MNKNHHVVGGSSDTSGGLTIERKKRAHVKKYEICLVEKMPYLSDTSIVRTVVGTAFEREDGLIRAVFKEGISVTGSVDIRPVSGNA